MSQRVRPQFRRNNESSLCRNRGSVPSVPSFPVPSFPSFPQFPVPSFPSFPVSQFPRVRAQLILHPDGILARDSYRIDYSEEFAALKPSGKNKRTA